MNDRDHEALATFFMIFWAAVVLNPRGLQHMRGTMVSVGLVKPRGKLALSPSGRRVMKFIQAPGRPKYRRQR